MIRNLILGSALTASLLVAPVAASSAESAAATVQPVGWHHGWHGGWHRGFWGGPYWWGPPVVGYGWYGRGYGRCGWLHRRAVYTGSPYWWHRYHECRYW
jgi:opacity protein-like surface antigen